MTTAIGATTIVIRIRMAITVAMTIVVCKRQE